MSPYNLRPRVPRPVRTDPLLTEIYDGLNEDVLRYIALLVHCRPPPYRLRSRSRQTRPIALRMVIRSSLLAYLSNILFDLG